VLKQICKWYKRRRFFVRNQANVKMQLNVALAIFIVYSNVYILNAAAGRVLLSSSTDADADNGDDLGRGSNPETDVHFLLWTRYVTAVQNKAIHYII